MLPAPFLFVRSKIPDEIADEIACLGGVDGLSDKLPSRRALGKVAALHGVLSDRVRLQLLLVLLEGKLCVCVLKRIVACPDTRLSYHLCILKRAGLVDSERDRSYLRYFLTAGGKAIAKEIVAQGEMKG
jgi:DNA-binding transcriptional ArsR family regulator